MTHSLWNWPPLVLGCIGAACFLVFFPLTFLCSVIDVILLIFIFGLCRTAAEKPEPQQDHQHTFKQRLG